MGLFNRKPQAPQDGQPPQSEPKGPGVTERAGRALWHAAQEYRTQRASARQAPDLNKHHATVADGIKTAFAVFVCGFCPFVILVILTVSAGYYFNALRPFSSDVQSVVAYGTALIVELVNLALFFVSAKAFWSGKRAHFVTALVVGLTLTVISVIAQVLYLSNNLDADSLGRGATILQGVPVVGSLASTGLIIVTRALALHVAEFACCYVIARSSVSHRKIIQAQQEEQEAELARIEAAQYMEFRRRIHTVSMAQLNAMTAAMEKQQGLVIEAGSGESSFRLPANSSNGKH